MAKVLPMARYEAGYISDYNSAPPRANSADREIYSAGDRLRDWARYLSKNSSIVKAILDSRVAKGVGAGISYQPMVRDKNGNLLEELNNAIRKVHKEWSKASDVTGELSRQEIERLVWRDWDTVGEVFARKVYRGRTAKQIGYQVQLIPSELVPYGFVQKSTPIMGVDRDEWGMPLKYWVYPYAPSSQTWMFNLPALQPNSIDAKYIKHLRRQEELNATRGVTLIHPVIFRVSDIAEYQQSHRRAARASANLFASINRDIDFEPLDENPPESYSSSLGQNELNLNDLQILDFLKSGESVNFHAPQHPNQNAVEFVNQELRQIASSCRVAFSWIAYVFDRAYAAQRTELVHAWEMIYEDQGQYIRDFALPMLYEEPLKIAILEGRLPARELRKADQETLYDVRIQCPVMPSIDPVSDRQAAQIDQEMGWESRFGNIRRFGKDPAQVDGERELDDFEPMQKDQNQVMQNDQQNEQDQADSGTDQGNQPENRGRNLYS